MNMNTAATDQPTPTSSNPPPPTSSRHRTYNAQRQYEHYHKKNPNAKHRDQLPTEIQCQLDKDYPQPKRKENETDSAYKRRCNTQTAKKSRAKSKLVKKLASMPPTPASTMPPALQQDGAIECAPGAPTTMNRSNETLASEAGGPENVIVGHDVVAENGQSEQQMYLVATRKAVGDDFKHSFVSYFSGSGDHSLQQTRANLDDLALPELKGVNYLFYDFKHKVVVAKQLEKAAKLKHIEVVKSPPFSSETEVPWFVVEIQD